jgi:hypothetical protein
MRRIAVTFVPRLLQNERNQHRLEVGREFQQQIFFRRFSLVTKGGFMAMSLKQSCNRRNENALHLGQKNL